MFLVTCAVYNVHVNCKFKAAPCRYLILKMKLSTVTIAALLCVSVANASEPVSLEQQDNNQITTNERRPDFTDVVNHQRPLYMAFDFMTVPEFQNLAVSHRDILSFANKTTPKVREIAKCFKMPSLTNLQEHPDLALFEGYTFSDSREDSFKKVTFLLDICEKSLLDSPILATIHEAIIDEMDTWSDEELTTYLNSGPLASRIEDLIRVFYGLEKYESLLEPRLIRIYRNVYHESDKKAARFFSESKISAFMHNSYGREKLIKQYMQGEITAENFGSSLASSPNILKYTFSVINYLIFYKGSVEYSDDDLAKILELMSAIQQALLDQDLLDKDRDLQSNLEASKLYCEFLLGEKGPEDVLAFVAQKDDTNIRELFFIALLRKNLFEAAANAMPSSIYKYKVKEYVLGRPDFIKYLYDSDKKKLEKCIDLSEPKIYTQSQSLYAFMARGDPLVKALFQPDSSAVNVISESEVAPKFDGVCEEDLLIIYNNSVINSPSGWRLFRDIFVDVSIKLVKIKLRTPEGREWILSQFENNGYWRNQLQSEKLAGLIYNLAKLGDSVTKYLNPNDISINSDAVIRDLDDPVAFARNKRALSGLFSLRKYLDDNWRVFPVEVFNSLNRKRLQRVLEIPGMDLDQVAEMVVHTKNWFPDSQIVMMEMMNREGIRSIFEKLGLPYPKTSQALNHLLSKVIGEVSRYDFPKESCIELVPHMNDYRKKVVLLTLATYQKNQRRR